MSRFIPALSTLKLWLMGLVLSLVVNFWIGVGTASAAETVILHFRDRQITIPNREFVAFANPEADDATVSQDLQAFFQTIPLTPDAARALLNETVLPSISVRLNSNLNQFLAIQLNKLMGNPNEAESLDALETVVANALADDRSFSMLELIDKYPKSTINVYLARLEQVHSDVNLFVERVRPLLEQADELLADLVCECDVEPPGPALLSPAQATQPNAAVNSVQFVACETVQPILAQLPLSQSPDAFPRLAKEVVITYGPLARSLSIKDLTTLAETGQTSRSLKSNLRLANLSPDRFRSILTQPLKADADFLNKNLNNVLGEFVLFEVGQIVHTHSRRANIQALRSALISSAHNDNQISLLEFLQHYPLPQVYIDGVKLAQFARLANASTRDTFVRSEAQRLEDFLVNIQAAIAAEVCTCGNPPTS